MGLDLFGVVFRVVFGTVFGTSFKAVVVVRPFLVELFAAFDLHRKARAFGAPLARPVECRVSEAIGNLVEGAIQIGSSFLFGRCVEQRQLRRFTAFKPFGSDTHQTHGLLKSGLGQKLARLAGQGVTVVGRFGERNAARTSGVAPRSRHLAFRRSPFQDDDARLELVPSQPSGHRLCVGQDRGFEGFAIEHIASKRIFFAV